MKTGRINERNIGYWTHGGEQKLRSKKAYRPGLTKEQERALEVLTKINNLIGSFNSNYESYLPFDLNDELIKQWYDNRIIKKGIKYSKYPELFPPKEICHVVPERLSELKLVAGLLRVDF